MKDQILATREEYNRRISICSKCDQKNGMNICTACGCIIPLKAKLEFAGCPLKKWKKD